MLLGIYMYGQGIIADRADGGDWTAVPTHGKPIILCESAARSGLQPGVKVGFNPIPAAGKFDVAQNYVILYRPVTTEDICAALEGKDLTGVEALIMFETPLGGDRPQDPLRLPEGQYEYFVVASTKTVAETADQVIYDLGYGGGGENGDETFTGSGCFGTVKHVIYDFRWAALDTPRKGRVMFVPLEGLVDNSCKDCDAPNLVQLERDVLQVCVDTAGRFLKG